MKTSNSLDQKLNKPEALEDRKTLKEGSIFIRQVVCAHNGAEQNNTGDAFYNPAQIVNRDLSIVVLKAFQQTICDTLKDPQDFIGFNVVEPLAATGLRSLRYIKELGGEVVRHVVVNDIDPQAMRHCDHNRRLNSIPENLVEFHVKDAVELLYHMKFSNGPVNRLCQHYLPGTRLSNELLANFTLPSDERSKDLSLPSNHTAGESSYIFSRVLEKEAPAYNVIVDVVDIDPYGSAAPFLDSALLSVRNGGLLCITSTDMQVLCGNTPEVCFYRYGCASAKIDSVHELSLRILLGSVTMAAARYKRFVEPLACCSLDFYVRLFVRVFDCPLACKSNTARFATLQQCSSCSAFSIHPLLSVKTRLTSTYRRKRKLENAQKEGETGSDNATADTPKTVQCDAICESTNEFQTAYSAVTHSCQFRNSLPGSSKTDEDNDKRTNTKNTYHAASVSRHMGHYCKECGSSVYQLGPVYVGPLFNPVFVQKCLSLTKNHLADKESEPSLSFITQGKRLQGLFQSMSEELIDVPFSYSLPALCTKMNLPMIPFNDFRNALQNLDYKISRFHRDAQLIKTNAPTVVVFDIIREHGKKSKDQSTSTNTLFVKKIETQGISFTKKKETQKNVPYERRVPRWLPNPAPNWGPGTRHKTAAPTL